MKPIEPFSVELDMRSGVIQPAGQVLRRYLSDMRQVYADPAEVSRILEQEGDRLIYEVYASGLPEEAGHVLYGTTVLYPGRVGAEFHMTKGHFHKRRDRAEVYFGLAGEGYLILQTEDGLVRGLPMRPGTVAYVPPLWAHRTANTGDKPFIFFAAWPGEAGHDYGTIEAQGFARLLVDQGGQATFVANARYRAR